jgi:hypothetical protein
LGPVGKKKMQTQQRKHDLYAFHQHTSQKHEKFSLGELQENLADELVGSSSQHHILL